MEGAVASEAPARQCAADSKQTSFISSGMRRPAE